jgi:hypothetical protein
MVPITVESHVYLMVDYSARYARYCPNIELQLCTGGITSVFNTQNLLPTGLQFLVSRCQMRCIMRPAFDEIVFSSKNFRSEHVHETRR